MKAFVVLMILVSAAPAWAISGETCERHCTCDMDGELDCDSATLDVECDLRCDCDDVDEDEPPNCS